MPAIRMSTAVSAPQEAVWNALVDYEARPRWSPRVKEARVVGGPPLRQGSQIRLHIDRDRFTATVVEIRPTEHLSLLVKGPGFRVTHTYELRVAGAGTDLELTGNYRGVLGALAARFMGKTVRRDLADELSVVKAAAEFRPPIPSLRSGQA